MTDVEKTLPADDALNRDPEPRRSFIAGAAMAGGLALGYGSLATKAAQFLYQSGDDNLGWQFVARTRDVTEDAAFVYESPAGVKVVVARKKGRTSDLADDFVALSSVCPHLGCVVHWEPQKDAHADPHGDDAGSGSGATGRFFCPCHNGVFDSEGKPTAGPPADAKQNLKTYPVIVENGLLFVEVPLRTVTGITPS